MKKENVKTALAFIASDNISQKRLIRMPNVRRSVGVSDSGGDVEFVGHKF